MTKEGVYLAEGSNKNGGVSSDSLSGVRLKWWLLGKPRDPNDPHIFHKISLIAFLAWVGLGADGLSSTAYGPDEAFRALGHHTFLAIFLAGMMILTISLISLSYTRVVEHFPGGGGGYLVATKLLGPYLGALSGCALIVDYILTISISIASGVDAIFSFLPVSYQSHKLFTEFIVLIILLILNLRGIKESIKILLPIFILFILTHLVMIFYGIFSNIGTIPGLAQEISSESSKQVSTIGFFALLMIFLRAYSLGGGTYTGIEAVSNGIQILREPRVATAKRTMLYMALSLAITASGILCCYLLIHAHPVEGRTLNAVLANTLFSNWHIGNIPFGNIFSLITLLSEGFLLFVAAQTGFIDGPRILANMAVDSWVPHNFSQLSERLVTTKGILLMGGAAGIILFYTKGQVSFLVILYSINVFLTFTLTQIGMIRRTIVNRRKEETLLKDLSIHIPTLILCLSILIITTAIKFREGGWLTLAITLSFMGLCLLIQRHYRKIRWQIIQLDKELKKIPHPTSIPGGSIPSKDENVAVLMVSGFGGLGLHTLLTIIQMFPGFYRNIVFISVGVVDSGNFKGITEVEKLRKKVEHDLKHYVDYTKALGLNAECRYEIGAELLSTAQGLCEGIAKEYSKSVFFLGNMVFEKERIYYRLLHNDSAFAIQRRLQFCGLKTVLVPTRMHI